MFNTEKKLNISFNHFLNSRAVCPLAGSKIGNKWLKLHVAGTNIFSTWDTQLQDWRGGDEGWGILITS